MTGPLNWSSRTDSFFAFLPVTDLDCRGLERRDRHGRGVVVVDDDQAGGRGRAEGRTGAGRGERERDDGIALARLAVVGDRDRNGRAQHVGTEGDRLRERGNLVATRTGEDDRECGAQVSGAGQDDLSRADSDGGGELAAGELEDRRRDDRRSGEVKDRPVGRAARARRLHLEVIGGARRQPGQRRGFRSALVPLPADCAMVVVVPELRVAFVP